GDRLELLGGGIPRRDHQAERSFKSKLHAALGLVPGQRSHFTGSEAVRLVERLQSYGGELRGEGPRAFRRVEGLTPKLSIGPGGVALRLLPAGDDDAIDGEVGEVGERGDFALALSELRAAAPSSVDTARAVEAWRRGESMVPLLDGGWAPLPVDWFERHGEDIAFLLAARDDDGKLAAWATPTLARLCEALNEPPPPELDALAQLVDGFTQVPPAALPEDLTATLRDYQRRGVDWLAFLREAGLGAMLADDMGLGKTLQALCVIRGRTLIVTPTSVLHGWASELARFRPGVDVHLYHGPRRALVDDDGPSVTLTTYAVLRLDVELLADHRWDTVILDESQVIKNPESQVAQAAFRLEARFRVALTGTPVENRLEELWSQFHYLNRGLLGGRREFQDLYARPIAAGLHGAAARLRERIRPFLLRRRKQEVARELPPRTEVVLRCELDPEERRLYDAIRAATREEVVARLQAGGGVLQALEALLRMRQAACHRGLVPGQDATRSSKVDLLIETLEEVVAEGHKALVFSQWTGLLDKIEPALAAASLRYTRLDGSTRDRGAVVREFQDPDGPPVLLISLKAGGVGLNLTAADHVFLLDPWWNPATEDQAADRAHRIGQTRPVLIHRLVAEETVEERILELQLHKRALADAALEGADQAATLTRDDLLALLE
ncbi:MAG: DEAD/DEAH box helicase, partial [Myxococcales bacterium]|nr:DEAD/DEAH box helicase [Myxococcales bacterium]